MSDTKQKIDWTADYPAFREASKAFYGGLMDPKTYKGISGGFGSYAQKGGKASMLRLRMAGGRLTKERLRFIAEAVEKWNIDKVHFTTCQTVQLHNLGEEAVCSLAEQALDFGIITRGGGGDFPRNVMVSPLSGTETGEYFDVLPYAMKAADFLMGYIKGPKLPRKLKVCFSNSPANRTHATFRDLGFAARKDGRFDVYSAGGLGNHPAMGVKVAEAVEPDQILYYIQAMYELFLTYGNYENRAKARTRFMQETLGGPEAYQAAFLEKLEAVYQNGSQLTFKPKPVSCERSLSQEELQEEAPVSPRILPQKQKGLYSVLYHPIGGCPAPDFFRRIYEVIRDIDQAELRLSPDESVYIINCTAREAARVLEVTKDSAKTAFCASVACIGASICQQGVRDSQALLRTLVEMEAQEGFADGILPAIHISGCPSSCGTHQTGLLGFHGGVKRMDGQLLPAFTLHWGGCDLEGHERLGEQLGVILERDIPSFLRELGRTVQKSGLDFEAWCKADPEGIKELADPFLR